MFFFSPKSLPSEEYGQVGNECRPSPDVGQHDSHLLAGDLHRVHERLWDGVVTVDADAAQVQNGDGATVDVETVPDITWLIVVEIQVNWVYSLIKDLCADLHMA